MEQPACVILLVTTPGKAEAEKIARRLLAEDKAACVNIIPAVESMFRWQGKLDSAHESLLVVKTLASFVDEIVRLVKEEHPYEVPEVIALPIVGGNPDYLEWISKETGG